MSTTYNGGLGTTVTVRPADSTVTVGFDSTVVLIGANDGGNATEEDPEFIETQSEADNLFGSSSEIAKAYAAASAQGAGEVWGIAADTTTPDWTGAAEAAMGLGPRYIVVCDKESTPKDEVLQVVKDWANDLQFGRVFAPGEDVAETDVSTYTPNKDEHRFVEVNPLRVNVAGKDPYGAAAVAGHAARQPLGSSITYDGLNINGTSLEYRRSTAQEFERVTAITRNGNIVEGLTTSSDDAFADIFQVEIVDTVALGLDEIAQSYAGDRPNIPEVRRELEGDMAKFLGPLADGRPPLLADAEGGDAYSVSTEVTSDDSVTVTVGVSPVDVMKQIDINMNVGSVTTFDGFEA